MKTKPKYQTWIRMNKLLIFVAISLILLLVSGLPVPISTRLLSAIVALPFLYIACILSYSVYQFSALGGNYQSKIHEFIASRIDGNRNGQILDIGTGSGSLIIKLANTFSNARLTGIDYWGEDWEYSQAQCIQNAEIEGVSGRIEFLKASASDLPFKDHEFDIVVSCLTFHEVKDTSDKTTVLLEALRVLKPGGEFVFLDLFMNEKIFGNDKKLIDTLKQDTVSDLHSEKLADAMDLPKLLMNKKVLGNAMILRGKK